MAQDISPRQYLLKGAPGQGFGAVFFEGDTLYTYKSEFPKNSFYVSHTLFIDRMLSNNGFEYVGGNIVREKISGKELFKSIIFIETLTEKMENADRSTDVATIFSETYSAIKNIDWPKGEPSNIFYLLGLRGFGWQDVPPHS